MKRVIAHSVILSACFILLGNCVSLEHSADYTNRRTVLIFPIINATDRTVLRKTYYDEKYFFPKYGGFGRILWRELSDKGYGVLYAQDADQRPIPISEHNTLKNGHVSEYFSKIPYDYSIIVSLDSFDTTFATTTRRLICTLYLVDNHAMKLLWSKQVSKDHWRGLVGGPLEAITQTFGMEDTNIYIRNEVAETISDGFVECPLFTRNLN